MSNTKPELVSCAGDWASLEAAVAAGADSVYFGVKNLNMRDLAGNFELSELNKIATYLHARKRRAYLALNVVILPKDLKLAEKILVAAKKAKIDAVILSDFAAFDIARKLKLKIHISTQASLANFPAVNFLAGAGAIRCVLARECSLADIKSIAGEIKRKKLKFDIEVFIHGAMCVSYSGRCFMSQYTFGRSANQGKCLQPCRREYKIIDTEDEAEYVLGKDYILSPKDLCTVDFIDKLIETGVGAFKIEGRRRAPEYVAVATSVYRAAIDAYFENKLTAGLKRKLKKELACVYNRGFSTGFYLSLPRNWQARRLEHTREKVYLGEVTRFFKKIMVAELRLRNGDLKKGDSLLFIGKHTGALTADVFELEQDHQPVDRAQKGERLGVKLPFTVKPGDKVFLWPDRAKNL